MRRTWWPDRLAGRLALTIVAALLATQIVSVVVLFLVRPPPPHLYRVDELAETAADLATDVFALPTDRRGAWLEGRPEASWMGLELRPDRPRIPSQSRHPVHERLRARIAGLLDVPGDSVIVAGRLPGPLMVPAPMPRIPHRAAEPLRSIAEEPGLHIIAPISIAIRGNDGAWLLLEILVPGESIWRLIPFAAWVLSAGLVVTVLSLWAARRLTAPLRDVARAAERIGLDPTPIAITERGPQEIRVIVGALERMRERVRRFVDDRTGMLAAISHDLRTPLTRLRLRVEMSRDEELKQAALADIDAMQTMIAETLSFAAHDAHREHVRVTDLAVLVAGICDGFTDTGAKVRYRGPSHLTFACQPVGLQRAITNLVHNAVLFGGGARVVLATTGVEVVVVILDRGPGIPEDELDRVFRPFYRLSRPGEPAGNGVGLGLAVARNILRAHGGDVQLRSRRCGLAAIVRLPILKQA